MLTHRFNGAPRLLSLSRIVGLTTLVAIAGSGMSRPADSRVTIPAGTQFVGNLRQTLSTHDHIVGNRVEVRTTEAFRVEDVNLPPGLSLRGEVTEAKDGGRVSGESVLSIRFTRLAVDGREYQIVAEPFRIVGKSETKNSLKKVIGGTVAGGVVGAIAGNTSKGLLLGAVIGSGVAVATKGGHITLPAGQQLAIRLAEPVVVTLRSPVTAYPR
jgi:hypothetical protein